MEINDTTGKEIVIDIKELYKSFGDNHVLRGVNLEVDRGENVVVLGRSGTGKSVLIKIICGLLTQDEGSVIVLGEDVKNLRARELEALRLKVGFSFQMSALYDSMTVKENIAFPLMRNFKHLTKAEVKKRVDEVLDAVSLIKSRDQYPAELSGGQKKRIGIARTLVLRPEIMLYDEPTAGLDPISSIEINSLINSIKKEFGVSSIIITHDLVCAKVTGDRLVMMFDGVVQKQGTFEQVFDSNDERIKSFYEYNFT
ncbi:ATP-binding cassette domain-containing protein [Ferruginibacter paludis]|uniref:ABC transporter ATP-binding protein n=1 Tax=Ferruginibacter paludis TaxID=1310417 RepID=UPI0025B60C51|nr:ATP-binding cassette domain-containing protein [Ferruginibacter paludis]MDN3655614.1 ATP-binding cassette domain-containing protein [Ferruginibacter paludis]